MMVKRSSSIDPEKEQRILDAAIKNFAKNGYQNSKTDQIAEEAQVSKGLVFHYFGSKAKLYTAAVQASYDRLLDIADLSVWQDAPDLRSMVIRATKYKIQLQLDQPDEFNLSMSAYGEVDQLPKEMQGEVKAIWNSEMETILPKMIRPVIERLALRSGVKPETVESLMAAIAVIVGEKAKVMIQKNPTIKISDMTDIIQSMNDYFDILEHGFLDERQ